MKRLKNIYPAVCDFGNLHQAYLKARRGKRHLNETLRFEARLEDNLTKLSEDLQLGLYETGEYRTFHVTEPKLRLISALPFRDRVAQHSLITQIEPFIDKRFIDHSYACRIGKGAHKGANTAQRWLQSVTTKYGTAYCLKMDVAKYFASIDTEVLKDQLATYIGDRNALTMWYEILDSWGRGLPIGNLTSQLGANIYLNGLDQFVKHELRLSNYARYMDDAVIVHHDKLFLAEALHRIRAYLNDVLHLRLNNKTQIFPVRIENGRALDFLGYRIWPSHKRLRKDSVKRMRRRLKVLTKRFRVYRVDHDDVKQRLSSWLGHAKHADSHKIAAILLREAVFVRGTKP